MECLPATAAETTAHATQNTPESVKCMDFVYIFANT